VGHDVVERLRDLGLGEVLLQQSRRRRLTAIEGVDVAVAFEVVVVGVEHDLAGERRHRQVAIRPQRHRDEHHFTGRGGFFDRRRPGVRAELGDHRRERLGPPAVGDHDVVTAGDHRLRHVAADLSCADDSEGGHAGR
jgi:hypothetical protein